MDISGLSSATSGVSGTAAAMSQVNISLLKDSMEFVEDTMLSLLAGMGASPEGVGGNIDTYV